MHESYRKIQPSESIIKLTKTHMNNQNNLIFSAICFSVGGALLISPGIFPFFTTATWLITYLFFFLYSIYLGIRYIKKVPMVDQKKFFSHPLTITTSLAYLLILISSVIFMANIVELFRITL